MPFEWVPILGGTYFSFRGYFLLISHCLFVFHTILWAVALLVYSHWKAKNQEEAPTIEVGEADPPEKHFLPSRLKKASDTELFNY